MKKRFDCVEMKRRGAELVMAQLAGLTREEQLAYWAARGEDLKERQRLARARLAAEQAAAEEAATAAG
ncbi:MAG: hypothetical protein IT204_08405 [Fimbriimonadaceae bacterium]|nr:hypothetical protein [Fimbriimonadaceae bacterium]